ncbi:MAG TPA: BON domain-containing protein [Pyrinomonadaceae bacterium]|jgi:osmotically-inducible protein OsmY
MKSKILGIIALLALAVLLGGCSQTENGNTVANTNTNANANLNANTAAANNNANANTNRAPTRAEYEKNKQTYAEQAKGLGSKIGTGLDDGWLWTKTRFDLAAVDDLRDSTINVDVDNAVVTLTGTVANAAQKAKAETTAKAVEGVKGVKNMLKVVAAPNANASNVNTNRPRK